MSGRVLVTGAGGKTGRAVIAALTARGAAVRALVRDPERHGDLSAVDAELPVDDGGDGDRPDRCRDVEVVRGDQRDEEDLAAALEGCAAMYAIAPNVSPHERAMARAAVEACGAAGVPRLVFHSVIHPQLSAMPHHADKAAAEESVIESGLDWTILQPNAYLQNLAAYAPQLRAGTYRVPYATDRGLAMVDLRDTASVAADCLVDGVGVHACFELSGPTEVSADDVVRIAGDILGIEVLAERWDPDAWASSQEPGGATRRLHAMFTHYDGYGSPGDATVLGMLLGRKPSEPAAYLTELLG